MAAPVVIHPRAIDTPWTEQDGPRHRLVIPAAAVEQLDKLPVPDVEELGEWEIRWLDGTEVQVLDLATRKKWLVRRGQCGMGACSCDFQAWPADYTGAIPDAEPALGWPFSLDEAGWDALGTEVGRDVSELGWDELLEAVEEAWSAGEA